MTLRYFNFIPVYNNPKTITTVTLEALSSSPNSVLVYDDGSDQVVSDLFSLNPELKNAIKDKRLFVLRINKNCGKGAALREAIKWGVSNNFTHMITIDADGQFKPSEIPHIQKSSEQNPWSLVLGERVFEDNVPGSSIFGRKFSNMWVKIETGLTLADTQTGFRCYPLFWVQNIKSFRNRFDFEIELIVKSIWLGAGAITTPVSVVYPDDRVTHFKKILDNFLLTLMHTRLCTLRVFNILTSPFQKKSWSGKQSKASEAGTKFFTLVFKTLGIKACYFLLVFVSLFYFLFGHGTRSALKEYWLMIDPELNIWQVNKNVYLTIYHFGQSLVDQYHLISNKSLQEKIIANFKGVQLEESFLFSGHMGHFKVVTYLFSSFFKKELSTIEYVDTKSNYDQNTFGSKETKLGIDQSSQAVFDVYQKKQNNQSLAALLDRPTGNRYELVRFFDKLIPIDVGLALAAKALKAEMVFFAVSKQKREHYNFHKSIPQVLLDSGNPAQQFYWAREFSQFMETFLIDHPYSWSNFYPLWKISPELARPKSLKSKNKKSRKNRNTTINYSPL